MRELMCPRVIAGWVWGRRGGGELRGVTAFAGWVRGGIVGVGCGEVTLRRPSDQSPDDPAEMDTVVARHLDYASPRVTRGGRPYFRTLLVLFGAGGIFVNLAFIALLTQQLHQAQWVYHDLMQNPRAYGREIDSVTIASLRDLRTIWIAFCAFGIASAFGLLLAVELLVAASLIDRRPASADRRLTHYRRWKPPGIVFTVVALLWAGNVIHHYWVAATRHIPVGSGPPVIETAVLVLCASLPWWWIGKRFGGQAAAAGAG